MLIAAMIGKYIVINVTLEQSDTDRRGLIAKRYRRLLTARSHSKTICIIQTEERKSDEHVSVIYTVREEYITSA